MDNWDEACKDFVKVFPHDYKRALEAKKMKGKTDAENIPPIAENKMAEDIKNSEESPPASPPRKRERTDSSNQVRMNILYLSFYRQIENFFRLQDGYLFSFLSFEGKTLFFRRKRSVI